MRARKAVRIPSQILFRFRSCARRVARLEELHALDEGTLCERARGEFLEEAVECANGTIDIAGLSLRHRVRKAIVLRAEG